MDQRSRSTWRISTYAYTQQTTYKITTKLQTKVLSTALFTVHSSLRSPSISITHYQFSSCLSSLHTTSLHQQLSSPLSLPRQVTQQPRRTETQDEPQEQVNERDGRDTGEMTTGRTNTGWRVDERYPFTAATNVITGRSHISQTSNNTTAGLSSFGTIHSFQYPNSSWQ